MIYLTGLSYINDTDWIYENPGTADLLLINGTTLTDLSKRQSTTGSAFYQTNFTKCFDIPDTPEIWIRVDVFSGSDRWQVGNASSYSSFIAFAPDYLSGNIYIESDYSSGLFQRSYPNFLVANNLNTILLHMVTGTAKGIIEVWVNGDFVNRYEGKVNGGNDFGDIYMKSGGANSFFSNVTISNAEIANSFSEKISADLLRQTADYLSTFDCFIKPLIFATYIIPPEKVPADLTRKISKTELAGADLLRQINLELVTADTFRKVSISEKFSANVKRILGKSETAQADSFRQITFAEKISADLFRALRDYARADSFRKVNRVERKSADTVIRVPHILNYVVQPQTRALKAGTADTSSLIDTFKDYGITAFNITLNEKTLSDDFTLETTRPLEIDDTVQGTLLDYPFNFLVEETTQTDLIQTVRGRYNVDDLLYKWFTLTLDEKDFPSADWIATNVAHYFLLSPDVAIDDFTPTNFTTNAMMTYSDVLSSAFGWTSRVPQQQINVFIRGNTLHCIQRGKEHSVFDITDLPHSRPTINKKFNRVLVHNPNNDDNDDNDDGYKFNGTIFYKQEGVAPFQAQISISYVYENGLLIKEYYATTTGLFDDGGELKHISNYSSTSYSYISFLDKNSDYSSTSYSYISFLDKNSDYSSTSYSYISFLDKNSDEPTYYIKGKVTKTEIVEQIWNSDIYRGVKETNVTTQEISTSYNYKHNEKSVYLFHEHERTIQTESNITERTWADTYHVPVGNGWYAQTVYRNGIFQGANLSQGAPGNAVSPYTVEQTQENFKGWDVQYTQPENLQPFEDNDYGLSAIVDDSFPVKESEFKSKLNEALRWLHRKIEETVTVDLISPVNNGVPDINHIVDFTERVKLDGNEYFLVSNRISFTPRKFIQKLTLIRWY